MGGSIMADENYYVNYNARKLSDRLRQRQDNYAITDPRWDTFVRDHFLYLKEHSTKVTISPEDMLTYDYRLEAYLDSIHYPVSVTWIVRLINQIDDNSQFHKLSYLYLPAKDILEFINEEYLTYIANDVTEQNKLVEAKV